MQYLWNKQWYFYFSDIDIMVTTSDWLVAAHFLYPLLKVSSPSCVKVGPTSFSRAKYCIMLHKSSPISPDSLHLRLPLSILSSSTFPTMCGSKNIIIHIHVPTMEGIGNSSGVGVKMGGQIPRKLCRGGGWTVSLDSRCPLIWYGFMYLAVKKPLLTYWADLSHKKIECSRFNTSIWILLYLKI